jgi:1-acyl-sn-glycerol-3-phosphate acyltransferase
VIWESRAFRSRAFRCSWYGLNALIPALFDWRISGRHQVPADGAFLVACNHVALLDPPYAGACLPRECGFLAKRELFVNPFLRWLIAAHNAVPIRRGGWDTAAFRQVKQMLDHGIPVTIFPEGTRSRTSGFLDPKPGLGLLAIKFGMPILPMFIDGTQLKLTDLLLRRRPLVCRIGTMIPLEMVRKFHDGKQGYQALSNYAMARIGELRDGGEPAA